MLIAERKWNLSMGWNSWLFYPSIIAHKKKLLPLLRMYAYLTCHHAIPYYFWWAQKRWRQICAISCFRINRHFRACDWLESTDLVFCKNLLLNRILRRFFWGRLCFAFPIIIILVYLGFFSIIIITFHALKHLTYIYVCMFFMRNGTIKLGMKYAMN